jgi:hypothetical protein
MGWFSRTFHKISHKVKKINWADLAHKGKKGWSIGTQILGFARKAVPKLKQVAQVAALVPALSEFAAPVVAGLDTAGRVLDTIDLGRQAVEKEFPGIKLEKDNKNSNGFSNGSSISKMGTTPGVIPSVAIPTPNGITIGD